MAKGKPSGGRRGVGTTPLLQKARSEAFLFHDECGGLSRQERTGGQTAPHLLSRFRTAGCLQPYGNAD